MKNQMFYAWAQRTELTPLLDHTWVTTYDYKDNNYNSIQDVINAKMHFWYCWGSYIAHPINEPSLVTGSHLGSKNGDLDFAEYLVKSNIECHKDNAAKGTIFRYGIDGVCHQLANQVLYSTLGKDNNPLTVKGVRGYKLSSFAYGTYGIQHALWKAKINNYPKIITMAEYIDPIENHIKNVLQNRPQETIDKVLNTRKELQENLQNLDTSATHEDIQAIHNDAFNKINQLISDEEFEKIFETSPDKEIRIVNKETYNKSR